MRLYQAGRRVGPFPFPAGAQGGLCLGSSTGRQGSWVLWGTFKHTLWSLGLEAQPILQKPSQTACHPHGVLRATPRTVGDPRSPFLGIVRGTGLLELRP